LKPVALALATWFGCGYFPWGPGTVGSLAALAIAALVNSQLGGTRQFLLAVTFMLLAPSTWAAAVTARASDDKDPGKVVIDEVLGQWVTLLGATAYNPVSFALAFVLFRALDIWKPGPIRRLEQLPGGYGIMADDLAAGLVGALILYTVGIVKLY
jgi:phosphatidylglycerophosphatase A